MTLNVTPNEVVPDVVMPEVAPDMMASDVVRPEVTLMAVAPDVAMPEMTPTLWRRMWQHQRRHPMWCQMW